MPLVSVIMPCYNAGRYLSISVQSVIAQQLRDWELIIVNDGSTDDSKQIAEELTRQDNRIKLINKDNGGYVSARIHGYSFISTDSKYVIFYDADDRLDPRMLQTLSDEM